LARTIQSSDSCTNSIPVISNEVVSLRQAERVLARLEKLEADQLGMQREEG
jgi:hypothetical protein